MGKTTIRSMGEADWPAIRPIYEQGIATGNATFETKVPGWREWNRKMLPYCRLVAVQKRHAVGWAALSPYSTRQVYQGVAEVTIYISNAHQGQRIGWLLMDELIQQSEANGIWTLQASIFPENQASVRLHEKGGFRIVGIRERLGQLHGKWRDVVLMERRSSFFK